MRLLLLYLIGYSLLLAAAVLTLSVSGILHQLPRSWVAAGVGVAVLVGVLLALVSRAPRQPPRDS
jgi:hypothetical protein